MHDRHRAKRGKQRMALLALAIALAAGRAVGWGSGHNTQAQMVMDALPEEIRNFFPPELQQKIVREYSHYPDRARTYEEALLGKEAVAEIERAGKFTTGRLLHEDFSIALSFTLLTMGFVEKNPEHAAVWLGSVIHTIGDDGSHLPLISYLSDLSLFKVNIDLGLFDLSLAAKTEEGRELLKKAMADYTPRPTPDDPGEALRQLIVLAFELMDFGSQRQARLSASFQPDASPEAKADALAAMVELGTEGAQRAVDATVAAWSYAKQKKEVRLTEELCKQARAEANRFCDTKPLEHDTVYAGALGARPEGPAIGVVVEPSTFMGRSSFGYIGCVTLAEILRTLQAAGIPSAALDLRDVLKAGLPSPAQIPALVVCAGNFYCEEKPFREYVKSGGRILWLGGREKGMLGKLSDALKPANTNLLPVSMDWMNPRSPSTAIVARVSVQFLGPFEKVLGSEPRKFINNPNLTGWMTPRCNLQLDGDAADIEMLAAVVDESERMFIAGALREGDAFRHVFLPHYLLIPFVLSDDTTMDCTRLTLDRVGEAILLSSLHLLAPELVAEKHIQSAGKRLSHRSATSVEGHK